jgi:hypothetical protein
MLAGFHQGIDDRGFLIDPVQCDLDRKDIRIDCRLPEEPDDRDEAVVGVIEEGIPGSYQIEDILFMRQRIGDMGDKWFIEEIGAGEIMQLPEIIMADKTTDTIDIALFQPEPLREEDDQPRGHVSIDFKTDRHPGSPAFDTILNRCQEVRCFINDHFDLRIPCHPEPVCTLNTHSRKEGAEMPGDQIFEEDEAGW